MEEVIEKKELGDEPNAYMESAEPEVKVEEVDECKMADDVNVEIAAQEAMNEDETEKLKEEVEEEKVEDVEMAKKFSDMEIELADLKVELARLTAFEADVIDKENKSKIEFACNEIREDMSVEQIETWKAKVVEFDNISAWENALKAEAYISAKSKNKPIVETPKTFSRMGNPFSAEPKKSLWKTK